MPKGRYQSEYFRDPAIDLNRAEDQIFADVDAFSMEYFEDEVDFYPKIDFVIAVPPLKYEGKMVKGVFFSQAVDYLYRLFPKIPMLFHSIANAQWGAIPWSRQADGLFSLYENSRREAWFKQAYPDRSEQVLVPLQDADFTNEYRMCPVPPPQFTQDVICVSRLHDLKNIPLIAEAIKIHREKYFPIRMTLVLGKEVGMNLQELEPHEQKQWREVEEILRHPFDYITLVPKANHHQELPKLYSTSKVCVLGSLFEGKNRALHEAMLCNTPVVCFKQYNQYIRGETRAVPEGAGLECPEFNAESLADTIHDALVHRAEFRPRQSYLETNGRKHFFDRCLRCFDHYYRETIPDASLSQSYFHNLWFDLAVQDNYQLSLNDFLYGRNHLISHVQGIPAIEKMLDFYFRRFQL